MTTEDAHTAAVRAALPFFREQFKAPKNADKYAASRAKHQAIDHAMALASAIKVAPDDIRNPERPVVKAAVAAYRKALR